MKKLYSILYKKDPILAARVAKAAEKPELQMYSRARGISKELQTKTGLFFEIPLKYRETTKDTRLTLNAYTPSSGYIVKLGTCQIVFPAAFQDPYIEKESLTGCFLLTPFKKMLRRHAKIE